MKLTHYIYISAALVALSACSDDDIDRIYTVGEADNAIVLRAGVDENSESQITTRGVDGNHNVIDNVGGGHKSFLETNTKLALRVDGTWTNTLVSKTSLVTLGAASNNHNPIENMDPTLFWDDYGTADPDNMGTDKGRAKGLTIYGVGVDGYATAIPTNWEQIAWELETVQTSGWADKDLLTSNNIREGADGTYKFDDYWYDKTSTSKRSSNIIEFTHAMTKITVELTAGDGFPGFTTSSPDAGKFEAVNDVEPSVTLLNFYYKGNVNVISKISTPATTDKGNIQMHLPASAKNQHKATFDALVYPGISFDDDDQIITLAADGNSYKVTAKKLNEAIKTAITNNTTSKYPGVDKMLLQGWNYLIKVRVNKTDLDITATILDWTSVTSEVEKPVININTAYGIEPDGTNEKKFEKTFDFFRSTIIGSGYSYGATITYNSGTSKYDFSTPLFWPDHNTHYFFRGVYPKIGSETGLTSGDKVTSDIANASTIAVGNVAYEPDKYPSDLAIGYPRTTTEKCTAHSKTVATAGICATEGEIRMNFRYVMSQIEVKLTSEAGDGDVNLDENTVIKISGGYTAGNIKLEDGSAVCTGSTADWIMLGGTSLDRLDAIVPQTLGDMKFVITVKNGEDNYDTYECKIASIKVGGNTITAWEPGKKYVYTLEIQKTAIKVTATLTDWVTVTASENVWF